MNDRIYERLTNPRDPVLFSSQKLNMARVPQALLKRSVMATRRAELPLRSSGTNLDPGLRTLEPKNRNYSRFAHSDPRCGVPRKIALLIPSCR